MLLTVFLNSENSILGNTILYFNISAVIEFAPSRNTLLFIKYCGSQSEVWTSSISMAWKLVRNENSSTAYVRNSEGVEPRNLCLTSPPDGSDAHYSLRTTGPRDILIDV